MTGHKGIRILHVRTPGPQAKADTTDSSPHRKDDTQGQKNIKERAPRHGDERQDDERPLGHQQASPLARGFTAFANAIAHVTGRPVTFVLCCVIIIVWAASGPIFHYSDTWQLIINTGTTIITFLMVFLIQNTQNRDGAAVQAKLDELIRAVEGARNHFIGIEHLTEEQLEAIRAVCEKDAEAEAVILAGESAQIGAATGAGGKQN
jgi:low affinity Fe/Cu permease